MTKQNKQLLILVGLVVAMFISWRINRIPTPVVVVVVEPRKQTGKEAAQESPLNSRFHRIRAEIDGLYHYRLKPISFTTDSNPFRLPGFMEGDDSSRNAPTPVATVEPVAEAAAPTAAPVETGDELLKHAVEASRFGGVVTMNDISELNVNGELHREGEVFTARVASRLVLIRIKRLTTTFAILSLDDPETGNAEFRIRLN